MQFDVRAVRTAAGAPGRRWVVVLEQKSYFVAMDQIAAVPIASLGEKIASAEHLRDEITRALDLLFTGF